MWTAGALVGLIPYERTGLNHLYCTPNKLWEYPNANVPILCSPLVEMTKVIEENGVGWLLPETSTPEAIAAVVNNLSDEDLTRAREACASYIARDNWSTYEGALLGLYERILARQAA
jgi:glycosyltransferase involved in cell wall biosynthesis